MKSKHILYKVLQWAFIEIRYEARYEAEEHNNNKIFAISHTLHNLPLHLMTAETDEDYDLILRNLEEQVRDDKGMTGLITDVKRRMAARQQPD